MTQRREVGEAVPYTSQPEATPAGPGQRPRGLTRSRAALPSSITPAFDSIRLRLSRSQVTPAWFPFHCGFALDAQALSSPLTEALEGRSGTMHRAPPTADHAPDGYAWWGHDASNQGTIKGAQVHLHRGCGLFSALAPPSELQRGLETLQV